MLKIIKKLFTNPENIQDSSVEISIDIPASDRQAIFTKATQEATKKILRETIHRELVDKCYTVSELEQTKHFISKLVRAGIKVQRSDISHQWYAYYNNEEQKNTITSLHKGYDLVSYYDNKFHCIVIGREFNLDEFVNRLVEGCV